MSDSTHVSIVEIFDGIDKFLLHLRGHLACPAHVVRHAWHNPVVDRVRERVRMRHVADSGFVFEVQPQDTQCGNLGFQIFWGVDDERSWALLFRSNFGGRGRLQRCLIHHKGLLPGGEVATEGIGLLFTIPFLLPLVQPHTRIVHPGTNEEIATCDGVIHRHVRCSPQSICVRRQFCTLQTNRPNFWVLPDGVHCCLHDARKDSHHVNLFALGDSIKTRNILKTDNDQTPVFGIDAAFISQQITHGLQCLPIGGEDCNLLLARRRTRHRGQMCQRGHENRLRCVPAGQPLKPHHETTIASDTTDSK
mmetsp:Transcript_21220/g.56646  ORF Transcript_21220/g.56646 Transcript_21220/m.56646 type:complete len:306 (-) Transcript_21220:485-1402(-)